jgi:hypothetical protein
VIGADDQRGADQVRRARVLRHPRLRERQVDRRFELARGGGDAREQVEDAPSRLRDRPRAEIERQRISRGDERQDRLRAVDERELIGRGAPRDDVQRRIEEIDVERSGPDQRRHILDGVLARKLFDVVSAVVELPVGDQRDRGLENRHSPPQRMLRCFLRVPSLLGAHAQPLHVLARVPLFPRRFPERPRSG